MKENMPKQQRFDLLKILANRHQSLSKEEVYKPLKFKSKQHMNAWMKRNCIYRKKVSYDIELK